VTQKTTREIEYTGNGTKAVLTADQEKEMESLESKGEVDKFLTENLSADIEVKAQFLKQYMGIKAAAYDDSGQAESRYMLLLDSFLLGNWRN
jgi:hypothetical protein